MIGLPYSIKIPRSRFALPVAAFPLAPPALATLVVALFLAGCGMPGAPSSPSLKLPDPVTNLTANRVGDQVTLKWTTPKRSTDKLLLKGPQDARVLRESTPTVQPQSTPGTHDQGNHDQVDRQTIAILAVDPGTEVAYADKLPGDLTSGPLRQLSYMVLLQNHAGQSAASSNVAYSAAGASPPPLTGLAAAMGPDGAVLRWTLSSWQPGTNGAFGVSARPMVRIHRTLQEASIPAETPTPPAKKGGSLAEPASEAKEQTLVVTEQPQAAGMDRSAGSASALDPGANFNRRYRYVVERVWPAVFGTHAVAVAGLPSAPAELDTRDVFPPLAPADLVAIAVPEEKAIDLSWTPNTEPDLAGYVVYRREDQGSWSRISPGSGLVAPTFRDAAAAPGRTYSYVVTAIDQSSNESAQSKPVEERLP